LSESCVAHSTRTGATILWLLINNVVTYVHPHYSAVSLAKFCRRRGVIQSDPAWVSSSSVLFEWHCISSYLQMQIGICKYMHCFNVQHAHTPLWQHVSAVRKLLYIIWVIEAHATKLRVACSCIYSFY